MDIILSAVCETALFVYHHAGIVLAWTGFCLVFGSFGACIFMNWGGKH